MNINNFNANLLEYDSLTKDGIYFTNMYILSIYIDDIEVLSMPNFDQSFVYYEELKKSLEGDGKYLIFTCACGVADDNGSEGILVKYFNDVVSWKIIESGKEFIFDLKQYTDTIIKIQNEIYLRVSKGILQPEHVIFPEEW